MDAHAGLRLAVQIDRAAPRQRKILEPPAAVVEPQLIRRAVVGDEDVDPAVAVEVAGDDAKAVADGRAYSRPIGDVGERAVAVVVVQRRRRGQVVGLRDCSSRARRSG